MLSGGGFIEGFLDFGLGDFLSKFSGSDAPAYFEGLPSELESSDGDDLSFDIFSIDKDSVGIHDIDDGDKLAFLSTVVDSCDSTYFNETRVSLSISQFVTIGFL